MCHSDRRLWIISSLCLVILLAAVPAARAVVSDDFNDGDDTSPAWSHYEPIVNATCIGAGNPASCCTGAGTGTCATTYDASSNDYAISVTATGNPLNPARALSLREQESFGNVVVGADLVAWDDTADHSYGIAARGTSTGASTKDGYGLLYIATASAGTTPAGSQIRLLQFDAEVPTILNHTLVALNPSNDYRLVLTITGTSPAVLTGKIFLKTDLVNPVATVTHSDSAGPIYTSGFTGLVVADGSAAADAPLSATFDNFSAGTPTADTDNDGFLDGDEVTQGTSPTDRFDAPLSSVSISDDFNDGNDTTPLWSHFAPNVNASCIGAGNPASCCTGAGTGTCATTYDASSNDYAISVTATGNPLNPARALSVRQGGNEGFRNTLVAADLVAWDDLEDHAFGLWARPTPPRGRTPTCWPTRAAPWTSCRSGRSLTRLPRRSPRPPWRSTRPSTTAWSSRSRGRTRWC